MPIGPSPNIGLISYTAIKVIGYSLVGWELNRRYQSTKPRPYVFGIVRTLLGIVVGITSLFLLEAINSNRGVVFFIFLMPIRLCEWLLVLYIFYERKNFSFKRILKYSFLGIV